MSAFDRLRKFFGLAETATPTRPTQEKRMAHGPRPARAKTATRKRRPSAGGGVDSGYVVDGTFFLDDGTRPSDYDYLGSATVTEPSRPAYDSFATGGQVSSSDSSGGGYSSGWGSSDSSGGGYSSGGGGYSSGGSSDSGSGSSSSSSSD